MASAGTPPVASGAGGRGKRASRQIGRSNSDEAPPKKHPAVDDGIERFEVVGGGEDVKDTRLPGGNRVAGFIGSMLADEDMCPTLEGACSPTPPAKPAAPGHDEDPGEQQQVKQHIDRTRSGVMDSLKVMQARLSALSGTTAGHCKSIDKAVEKRMCRVEHKVEIHDTRTGKLDQEVQDLRDLLGLTRKEEPTPRPAGGGSGFDREIDHTVITVRTKEALPKAAVADAVAPWLQDSSLVDGDYEVSEEPVDKRYQILVTGQRSHAARRVNQAIGALKLPVRGAGWRRITAPSPMGGVPVELSISPDKSPEQVAGELGCKEIVRALSVEYPAKKYFVDQGKGGASSLWKDLISYEPAPGSQAPTIHCSQKNMELIGMHYQKVRDVVGNLFSESEATEWCL
ncbi:unnamed protein product [Prorocentrum cordatum]|uniref:Uncharacterized protein n=1 Tax=Prorocentrum cordatum TaxID=2364126 RepID=A0ABN9SR56_9DINO|nr:unnamed protein product [Polarella glacialis]